MKKKILFLVFIVSLFAFNSCDNNPNSGENKSKKTSKSSTSFLPNVSGVAGEIMVVIDNFNWKNKAGETLRLTLEQEYPALNQAEPLFDIMHVTSGAFEDFLRLHRTIIMVEVDSEVKEPEIKYLENLWASPQLVLKIKAPDSYVLEELLDREKDNILRNILSYDRKRLADIYSSAKDAKIKNIVSKFNMSLAVPRGYDIDINNKEFASFSIETAKTSQVIFAYQYPASRIDVLNTENIIKKRNEFLKKYTKGTRDNSYLTTAEIYPPLVYDIKKEGREIVELRGLWELHNGFMGGPFISHSTIDKKRNLVLVVEGYVYYPNNKKRNMMRQVEAIVYSLKLLDE